VREWSDADHGAIRAFAIMLGRLVGAIAEAQHKTELTAQLQFALDSRIVIEQAKGMLMQREGIDAPRALELLRRLARSSECKLVDVASDLIDRPPERV
jgi:AmiR/NasT family two-component response regulator